MKKLVLFVLLFFVGTIAFAQGKDALLDEAETLIKKIQNKKVSKEDGFKLIDLYLKKAQKTKRNDLIGRAYFMYAINSSEKSVKLQYIDSVIYYTKNIKGDSNFPFRAYIFKGFKLYGQNKYKEALDYFILAESAAKLNNEVGSQYNVKFNIASLKRLLGVYEDAEKLFLEYKEFNESRDEMNKNRQLQVLFQLSSIYYETQKIKQGTLINEEGIRFSKAFNNDNMYYSFVVNEGINLSIKGDYVSAIDSLEKGYPHLIAIDKQVADFYLGKSYYALGEKEKGLNYFKKIDTTFNETNDLYPPLISAYEYLINDSKSKKDIKSQLYYTNQLLKVDTIADRNYKYLLNTIFKKHDIPKYMEDRDTMIYELKVRNGEIVKEKDWILIISILVCLLTLVGLLYNYRLKRIYEKRYQEIITAANEPIIEEEIKVQDISQKPRPSINIDEVIVEEVLGALKVFENGEMYLTNQISLKDVAKIVNTNSKYLSKIVNSYKGKNFTTYINDLRIDYLVSHVQTDTKYQKYTIRAIAEEIGFSNPEGFSRAFQKKTGLKPSYFIKKVRENK